MKRRWLSIGLLALAIFVINAVARFISWKADVTTDSGQVTVGIVGVIIVAALLVGVTAWAAIRYPLARLVADIGAAVLIGALLSVILGPLFAGSHPFAEGLGLFVGQVLLFLAVAAVGVFLGFAGAVALGQDWRSRGLLRFEQSHSRKRRTSRDVSRRA